MHLKKDHRRHISFRQFLVLLCCLLAAMSFLGSAAVAGPIRVVVWDEREAAQKTAYGGFLGDTLAAHLSKERGLNVKSVGLDDPDQGLSDAILDNCDVLIWWGHERHAAVTDAHTKAVVDRLKSGQLSLIVLHSAHWSKPFKLAMAERAVEDALKAVPAAERGNIKIKRLAPPGGMPKRDAALTPSSKITKQPDGTDELEVTLPGCIFPVVNNAGKPSHMMTLLPKHPIAKGIPATFDIPQTEIYGGPFHVPVPDATIFGEHWDNGEAFPSGCAWQVGNGRVFYFRPGHETYPIYNEEIPYKIIVNAIRWAAAKK
jgi:trehalose utilization protein